MSLREHEGKVSAIDSTKWEIDHIGIAVSDLDAAIQLYRSTTKCSVTLRETLTEQGVELAFIDTPETKVELLAPTSDGSKLAKFIAKRGAGLHHICYRVSDIEAELARLSTIGFELIDTKPRHGAGNTRIAFISPRSFDGVLTELCEYPPA